MERLTERLGVHFAIDNHTAARLLTAADDGAVLTLIAQIEETCDVDYCDTDKAWDPIHRSLTDGRLGYDNGSYPYNAAVLGGHQLYEGDKYVVSLTTPDCVRDIAAALSAVDRDRLSAGYKLIDASDYEPPFGAEDFGYTWNSFTEMTAFFRRAAAIDKHVIFTAALQVTGMPSRSVKPRAVGCGR